MSERGVNPSDYPDEQIGVDGYSIDDLIEHVEELIAAAPMAAEGGKRKSRKSRKTRKHKREKGCTEPLYGKKARCILNIVPQNNKGQSIKIDKKCMKHR